MRWIIVTTSVDNLVSILLSLSYTQGLEVRILPKGQKEKDVFRHPSLDDGIPPPFLSRLSKQVSSLLYL